MDFLNAGWIWLYIGAGLMLAEILAPGFILFFFGLSAATLGGLILVLPEAFHLSLTWQLALFSLFSVVYLVTLRRYLKSVFLGDTEERNSVCDEFTGRLGEVVAEITPEVPGRVVVGDSQWDAVAACKISAGAKVKIIARRNLTLTVEAI
ncbi:MAG: NfeD family protein [Kiritimatiellae bacterium]|nr:NfeD family protein [Kiritimatiellia bacterium]